MPVKLMIYALLSGPEGYPRVLDYSIFKSLLVPYPKNFTTRASSRVVMIFIFCPIIQVFIKWKGETFVMDSVITPSNKMLQLQ